MAPSPAFRFFRVTLPMSAPVLFIALILRLIDAFKQYDLFFALTGGGPGSSTETVSFAVAKTAFSYFYTGEASALAVILLVIIIGLSMIFVRHLAPRWARNTDGRGHPQQSDGIDFGGFKAVDDVNLDCRARRVRRLSRPVRLRQDDDAALHCRPGKGHLGRTSCSTGNASTI